jgi:hypothetical protein
MTFDGTCERGGVQRAPQEIEERSPARWVVLLFGSPAAAASASDFWLLTRRVPCALRLAGPCARWVVLLFGGPAAAATAAVPLASRQPPAAAQAQIQPHYLP